MSKKSEYEKYDEWRKSQLEIQRANKKYHESEDMSDEEIERSLYGVDCEYNSMPAGN